MFTLSLSLIIILTTIDKPNIELKISPNVQFLLLVHFIGLSVDRSVFFSGFLQQ
jgi:hypothetical protein